MLTAFNARENSFFRVVRVLFIDGSRLKAKLCLSTSMSEQDLSFPPPPQNAACSGKPIPHSPHSSNRNPAVSLELAHPLREGW